MKIANTPDSPNSELNKSREITIKVTDKGNAPFAAQYLKEKIKKWLKLQDGIGVISHTEYSITINTDDWEIS